MKLPKSIVDRIVDEVYYYNQKCRLRNKFDLMFCYTHSMSSVKSSHDQHVFLDYNFPNSLVLITWPAQADWKRIEYKITTNDGRFDRFVRPIVNKYVREMYDYYNSPRTA